MRKTLLAVAATTLGLLAAGTAHAVSVDFAGGYFRSGMGTNAKGGDQVCFGLPGVSKYRLGNECDAYGEVGFQAELAKLDNGPKFNYNLLLNYGNAGTNSSDTNHSGEIRLVNNFVSATGIGSGALQDASFWVGRRNYMRSDVHITDFTYWGMAGSGMGLENIDLGMGKLHVALFRSYNPTVANGQGAGVTGNSLDFRVTGIDVNAGGQIDGGIEFRTASKDDVSSAKGGLMLTLQHRQDLGGGGTNTTVLQFGKDAGSGLTSSDNGSYTFTTQSTSAWRVIVSPLVEMAPNFSVQGLFLYQKNNDMVVNGNAVGSRKWMSLGARPMFYWNDYMASAVEFGHDRVSFSGATDPALNGKTATLTKLTIAPVIVRPGFGFFKRPELRLFATFAKWNSDANSVATGYGTANNNITGSLGYAGSTSGTTIGAQVEAWW